MAEDKIDSKKDQIVEGPVDALEGQKCPMCLKDTLTLTEQDKEIPYFGRVCIFGMTCTNCKYHKADIDTLEKNEPAKYSLAIEGEDDMNIRVVRSSEGVIKIPRIMTIEPGPAANGFITNVEGLFRRAKYATELARDNSEDKSDRKKAKNMLKKIQKIMWGQDKITISIEDPTGNSAIISDKAVKTKMKGKKKK